MPDIQVSSLTILASGCFPVIVLFGIFVYCLVRKEGKPDAE